MYQLVFIILLFTYLCTDGKETYNSLMYNIKGDRKGIKIFQQKNKISIWLEAKSSLIPSNFLFLQSLITIIIFF